MDIRRTENDSLFIKTEYGFDSRQIEDVLKYMKENNGIDLSKSEKE